MFEDAIAAAERAGQVQDAERGLVVLFYDRPVHSKFQSKKEGRPVYVNMIYVKIMAAGQQSSTVDRKKKPEDEQKYPRAWQRYQDKSTLIAEGTLIEEWSQISRSRAAELKHDNVLTVELLAGLTDAGVENIGPDGRTLRTQAKNFLANRDEKDVELEELKDQLTSLQQTVKELKAAAAKPTRKKPGPKPKGGKGSKKEHVTDEPTQHSAGHA